MHKAFCKAFSALRTALPSTYPLEQLLSDNDDDVPPIGAYERDVLMSQLAAEMQDLIQRIGRFDMGKIPNYLLYLEPRCLWCYRTKAHISATQLLSCPDCLGATYCCTDHRNKGRAAHTTVISDNGLTQVCGKSTRVFFLALIALRLLLLLFSARPFRYAIRMMISCGKPLFPDQGGHES